MTTDLTLFKNNALTMNERFQRMMEDTDRVAGMGRTSRRISIRGGRFREIIGGDQQRVNSSGSMNVVIVRASRVSRTYYEGAYDPEKTAPPRCWSADTEKPSDDLFSGHRVSGPFDVHCHRVGPPGECWRTVPGNRIPAIPCCQRGWVCRLMPST